MKFNFDVTRIKWKLFIMNFAYGIKRFILKEEAELPSAGYNDVITLMKGYSGVENFVPWSNVGKPLNVRTPDELKVLILGTDEVKDIMATLVRERAKQYQNHLQEQPAEDKIY